MGITYGDHLIDSGYHDITPEQEREIEAREECERRGIDPDELCADGGVEAWMIVAKEMQESASNSAANTSERISRAKAIVDEAVDAVLRSACPGYFTDEDDA